MTIKDRLEEWQVAVSNCRIYIKELAGAVESATHSMTAFEYQSRPMPEMYSQPGEIKTGFQHAIEDLENSRNLVNRLEDTGIIHTPPGLYEAYAKLIRLAQDKGWDESIMESAYNKLIEFLVYLAGDDIASACIPKPEGDNPYPKPRPLTPLTKKELEGKIADMKLRIDLEKDPNRHLQYRSALRSYELRLKEVGD